MNIDHWIQSQNPETLENILVDILVTDGLTYSGFISSVAYVDDLEHILLMSRPPSQGLFVAKKISKKDIIGFNFSITARANFGVHQIRIAQNGSDLQFQHTVHDDQQFTLTSQSQSKDKFKSECLSYIQKLSSELLPNEFIGLIFYKDKTIKYSVEYADLKTTLRDFLSA